MKFNEPTMVKFYESGCEHWSGGIAYGDEIICACCGGILEIAEIIQDAEEDGVKDPIQVLSWINLRDELLGE